MKKYIDFDELQELGIYEVINRKLHLLGIAFGNITDKYENAVPFADVKHVPCRQCSRCPHCGTELGE